MGGTGGDGEEGGAGASLGEPLLLSSPQMPRAMWVRNRRKLLSAKPVTRSERHIFATPRRALESLDYDMFESFVRDAAVKRRGRGADAGVALSAAGERGEHDRGLDVAQGAAAREALGADGGRGCVGGAGESASSLLTLARRRAQAW